MRKTIGEINTTQFTDSQVMTVSFEISDDDWCLLRQSETWNRIENFLVESGNRDNRMSLIEKVNLLETGCYK